MANQERWSRVVLSSVGRWRFVKCLSLVVAGGLLAACAAAAPPTPTPAPAAPKPAAPAPTVAPKPAAPAPAPTAAPKPAAPAAPKALVKLRQGNLQPQWSQVFKVMAAEKGFYREQGLDVEIVEADGSNQLKALLANQLDTINGIDGPVIIAIEQGADLVFVGAESRPNDMLFARSTITKPEDLVGKKIGINAVGSQSHELFLELFHKRGIDPQKMSYVSVGGDSARIGALISGQIDATSASIGNIDKVEQAGGKALVAFTQELPNFIGGVTTVQGKLLREKPEVVEAHVTAIMRGMRYAIEHPDEAAALGMKILKESNREVALKAVNNFIKYKMVNPNFVLTPDQVNLFQDANVRAKTQKAKLSVEKIANFEIANRVLAKLGKYPGW